MRHPVQCVFITDLNFLYPTLFSLWSLLRHTSTSTVIHFWGNGLTEKNWDDVSLVMETSPNAHLCRRDLSVKEMKGATGPDASKHVTASTMARLLIPDNLTGRVLYIDGDTVVKKDVSEIFDIDMGGRPIGAVRDFVMTKRHIRGDRNSEDTRKKMDICAKIIGKDSIGDYVNAGILIMDIEEILSLTDLHAAMSDISTASAWPYGDQDHLNHVFKDKIYYLNPAWNSSWGRTRRQRHFISLNKGFSSEIENEKTAIIHFHGPNKPWKVPRYDFWTSKGRSVISYRKEMLRYLKQFPHLAF